MRYSFRELSHMDHLDADALRSLYSAELGGEVFYKALAARFDHPEVVTLLRRNGREEASHARRIRRAIAMKEDRPFEPEPELLDTPAPQLPDPVDQAFLRNLADGEMQGDIGYQRWAANEPDPAVARLLRLNGREESIHSRRVQSAITLLETDC